MERPRILSIDRAVSAARRLVRVAENNCWAQQLRQRVVPARQRRSPHPAVTEPGAPTGASYRAALAWLREHVTFSSLGVGELGDVIPTLLDCGEPRMALQLGERLCRVQRPDGSWATDESSVQAASRAVIGLSALKWRSPPVTPALRRGCAWLLDRPSDGRPLSLPALFGRASDERASLWATVALVKAQARRDEWRPDLQSAVLLGDEPWQSWAHGHATAPGLLLDLGRRDEVVAWATRQQEVQEPDGSLPAFPRASWTCPTCTALTAAVFCRLGQLASARRALAYLGSVQHASGGFPGSQGSRASFRPAELILDGTRAYLDAFHLFLQASFDEQVEDFSDEVEADDGRLEIVWREAGDLNGKRVLDAGCGRGCIARALASRFPAADIWGTDHSELMLSHLPAGMSRRRGLLQNLPFADGDFDLVICVEALEHAGNPPGAVAELCRVTRPGGLVVLVDKNLERAGALAIEPWEQWFCRGDVAAWLQPFCDQVQTEAIQHAAFLGPDLFLSWWGRRRGEVS
jgi:malonyl-CoA O-methyltransferase